MESSGGIQASLGGRYATALFELARESKAIDKVEASLANVRAALEQSGEFARLVASPLVSRQDAAKAVAASASAMGIDATTKNFLGVLAENRRLAQLPAIIRAFRMPRCEPPRRGDRRSDLGASAFQRPGRCAQAAASHPHRP